MSHFSGGKLAAQYRWRRKHPDKWAKVLARADRKRRLLRHGLTAREYDFLLQKQSGVCAICKKRRKNKNGTNLTVDHSHKTGKVRGLLCNQCNLALGLLEDCKARLLRAAKYLNV